MYTNPESMPDKKSLSRIETFRNLPRHVRLRVATVVTVIGGLSAAVLWGSVLLPLQLKHAQKNVEPEQVISGVVEQIQNNNLSEGLPLNELKDAAISGARSASDAQNPPAVVTPIVTVSPTPTPDSTPTPRLVPPPDVRSPFEPIIP